MTLQDGTGAEIAGARRRASMAAGMSTTITASRPGWRSPWSVVLEMPRTLDQAQRRETLLPLATAILLALLIALGGGLWASRRMREGGGDARRARGPRAAAAGNRRVPGRRSSHRRGERPGRGER